MGLVWSDLNALSIINYVKYKISCLSKLIVLRALGDGLMGEEYLMNKEEDLVTTTLGKGEQLE